jgi:hypothetical protein
LGSREPNIDLKPYLKEGENILKTRVIVGGVGEGWLQIRAKQNCCSKWDIKREDKMRYYPEVYSYGYVYLASNAS